MKKPILIINVPETNTSEEERIRMENHVKSENAFKDFEVVIFWGCTAAIYYPPKEEKE